MNQVAQAQQKRTPPIVQFKHDLSRLVEAKELALPSNVSAEAFRNAAIVAAQDNPQILQCSAETVFKSIRKLAAAGLVPDGREAALVPFKGSCTAIPMVFGLIKMARRSGDVRDIRAHTIYEKDEFEYVVGDEERLTHKPVLFGDKGDPIAYYAIAILKDGTIVRTFMDTAEVERIRRGAASQGGSAQPKGIWLNHYEQMAHKTVIRRLVKRLDLSAEDMRHITMDDDSPVMRDVTPVPEDDTPRPTLAQTMLGDADSAAQPLDGEILTDTPDEQEDPSQGEPDSSALEFGEGFTARSQGKKLKENPYDMGTQEWVDWAGGWNQGDDPEEGE